MGLLVPATIAPRIAPMSKLFFIGIAGNIVADRRTTTAMVARMLNTKALMERRNPRGAPLKSWYSLVFIPPSKRIVIIAIAPMKLEIVIRMFCGMVS